MGIASGPPLSAVEIVVQNKACRQSLLPKSKANAVAFPFYKPGFLLLAPVGILHCASPPSHPHS